MGISAQGAEPARLAPATAWNLRYDEQACRLVRTFGTDDSAVTLIIAKYSPDDDFEMMISGKGLKARGKKLRYRFVPAKNHETEKEPLFGTGPGGVVTWQFRAGLVPEAELESLESMQWSAAYSALQVAEQARAAEVESFEVSAGMERSFVLVTGKLDAAFAALDTCLRDLVETWGFDPAVQQSLSARPEPESAPGAWMSANDYPSALLAEGLSGVVHFRLDVDSSGMPTNCAVQASFSDPEFKKVTCRLLMKRARFKPAKDASGNSVASYWATSVKWIM